MVCAKQTKCARKFFVEKIRFFDRFSGGKRLYLTFSANFSISSSEKKQKRPCFRPKFIVSGHSAKMEEGSCRGFGAPPPPSAEAPLAAGEDFGEMPKICPALRLVLGGIDRGGKNVWKKSERYTKNQRKFQKSAQLKAGERCCILTTDTNHAFSRREKGNCSQQMDNLQKISGFLMDVPKI